MYSAHVHVFFMQIVPLDLKSDEQELKVFNVRMDDFYAIDLTFLQGFDQPTLAYLAKVRLYTYIFFMFIHVHVHVHVYIHVLYSGKLWQGFTFGKNLQIKNSPI